MRRHYTQKKGEGQSLWGLDLCRALGKAPD